jgi:hypothetical protein
MLRGRRVFVHGEVEAVANAQNAKERGAKPVPIHLSNSDALFITRRYSGQKVGTKTLFPVILRCELREPRRTTAPAPRPSSFEGRYAAASG